MAQALRDRIIPWYFVMFFAGLALVDGIFVTLAVRTHTGIVTEHAYEKGLAYNQVVTASEEQALLGWQASILPEARGLRFHLHDREGGLLRPSRVRAIITRPTQAGMDQKVEFTASEDGSWHTPLALPVNGLWEVRVFAHVGDQTYQHAQRLVLP